MIWFALIVGAVVCTGFVAYNAGLFHRSTPALATGDGHELSEDVVDELLHQAEQQGHRPITSLGASAP